jgi:outer membrane murein-binding lipoprotein Lpp
VKNKITYLSIIFALISTVFILTGCSNDKSVENEKLNETTNNVENVENNTSSNVNNKIVGEWEATETNNNTAYSLTFLYGTFISTDNELIFSEDGTYKLDLGLAYCQEGNYEIDGDTIKLVNTEYKGDSPGNHILESLIIKDEQIILKETTYDNKIVDVIFENKENIKNREVINTSNANTTQIENVTETTNNIESSSYNLDGDFMGIHKQDSLTSDISIQGNNITWISAGVELTGTFVIEDNNLKATWNDGKSSTLTIVSNEQLKGSEPFSSSGEIVIFNKK